MTFIHGATFWFLGSILAMPACASVVSPGDGSASDVPVSGDDGLGTDVSRPPDGPTQCTIVGHYITNGGLVMTMTLAADNTYSADSDRFVGTYHWNGRVLEFVPGPGSTSNECASRWGSSVNVTFDATCRQALVVPATDGCTGSGLLTTSSNLTRM